MEYVYAALILNETGEEINEDNVTGVLEAAGVDVEESRVKALVAALEDVDIEEAIETAAAAPAAGASAGGSADADASADEADADDDDDDDEAEAADEADDDEEEGDGGEGLGELFG
ncbi:50S ribosomal protein L12P [Halorubrum distributum JCM 9100]|uniref:Large ribosomal subunit protein P1 n=5 Tax=Halorubrum distributum TaxID=29283 RepID=M0EQC5_9EURY|nr:MULTISPECIES: 50S ribosomal protein P1 [Halorubrum distributum group]ELZ31953.1 50S ribosomal protein L12P [Halorubrum terrestre JCM 10247]ELZ49092.1 50S ribosomal protein L12P [Halorubrum distributum JCM 9100]ELZ52143.1 50S ribosomal protein L12P [Halorubrum distributum JCM 10118]EMA60131.1 50S ribosomal protein L12P [Halorubrum litoreum JCM 13561]MDV7350372.1 50S ribosomal protein P1 [Halorubrum distributum]